MASQQELSRSEFLAKYPHLRDYLAELQRKGMRPPTFAVQLSRDMRDMEEVNVLYPIGDPYFVHVYSVRGEKWRRYVVVQPRIEGDAWKALEYVDEALAYHLLRRGEGENDGDRAKVLERLLSEIVRPDPSLKRGEFKPVRRKGAVVEILAEPRLAEGIKHYVLVEKTAHGAIEPLIRDPYIEDISCTGIGPIFIVHKVFESCVTNIEFRDEKELDEFVVRLSIKCGRPVSFRNPIVDAQLPDGSRVNIVYGSDVSRKGSNFTIRKFSDKPISITQLVKWNVLSAEMAAYLWMLLESNMNVWFCGEAASGKTTLLRAAAVFIRPTYKIVSIEEVPEIVVPHDNWVSEVTRRSETGVGEVELFDLLKAALRQRPNYIIVGEVRGAEAAVAFQAMQTGHGVLSTFHAGSVQKLIQRMVSDPINVPKTFIDNLNCVVLQSAVLHPHTGKLERRVLSFNEILGVDAETGGVNYVEVFSWNPVTDMHEFRGEGTSYLLEEKVARMRGIPRREIRRIYAELRLRAEFIRKLIQLGVYEYKDVFRAVAHAYTVGVERALEEVEVVARQGAEQRR
jgi:flagellar protein FlaI